MSETQEPRLERLTELARKVWPDRDVTACVGDGPDEIGAGVIADADEDWAQMVVVESHPRALDALESALRVLADDCIGPSELPATLESCHTCIRFLDIEINGAMDDRARMRKRAERAERELAELRATLLELAEEWRRARASMEGTGQADALGVCANDLLEAAKGGR